SSLQVCTPRILERRCLMLTRHNAHKIRPDHLERQAVIYVRQSTLLQVRENTGSTTRQYDLVKRACDLGWDRSAIQVIDQDQGLYNDRLLLGFKGTMSEAELHWLRQRLQGGKLTKAEKGKLRFRLPVGLVYDPADHIVLDPDEAVQEAVRLVFTLFEQHGSA